MVDYTRSTGSTYPGTMMIRDTGTNVEFWIKAGSTATHHSAMPFGWVLAAGSGTSTVNYPTGAPWVLCAAFTVTTSQNVTFNLGATGTSGLGGPVSFTQYIARSTVPAAPSIDDLITITHTSMVYDQDDNSNGGSAITARHYQISTDSAFTGASWILISDPGGTVTLTGLIPGTKYYVRGRVTNAVGNSAPSASKNATTLAGTYVRHGGVLCHAVPYTKHGGVLCPMVPYAKKGSVLVSTS